ncbi:aldolase [Methylocystis sp. MJC1]|uniref:aldolase n=1 Tax=Methylocystis sp. MJC1 TaxID=2654282 RepID=UPI0013EA4DD3|nr:aldolase [Methylocystis sp. MJC1]MBU6528009.1 aldolase [Methylocystis sp. MJC1]UZX10928.1 aldolase [Methylocystis sp. MJC1]
MRSVLVLSANERLSMRALESGAAALLMRLGGAPSRAEARSRARAFVEIARKRERRPRLFVQVAPVNGGEVDDDLKAIVGEGLDGVFLEGCEGRADVQWLAVKLAVMEAESGLPAGALKIVALAAQTPAAVFQLGRYKGASPRLAALALDESGLPGGAQARATTRALLALGAAAAGVSAIEAPGAALAVARREGFEGFMAFSEEEIAAIEAVFDAP